MIHLTIREQRVLRAALLASVVVVSTGVRAQQSPEQTIALQQSMLQRANQCIDAYGNWVAAEQRLAQAQAEIARLKDAAKAEKPVEPKK